MAPALCTATSPFARPVVQTNGVAIVAAVLLLLVSQISNAQQPPPSNPSACFGEFSLCPTTGECTLTYCDGVCKAGEYRCPLSSHDCFSSVGQYIHCPGIKGTHLDWTLDDEERLDLLVKAANVTQMIAQLTGRAPAMPSLGIPAYVRIFDPICSLLSYILRNNLYAFSFRII